MDELVVQKLGPLRRQLDDPVDRSVARMRNPRHELSITVVGKITPNTKGPRYQSRSYESLASRRYANIRRNPHRADFKQRHSNAEGAEAVAIWYFNGILVPGGFRRNAGRGKVQSIQFARERRRAVLLAFAWACTRRDRIRRNV